MRLVQFETEDRLRLNGLLCDASSDTTIVHVHGKCGNFYENKFIKIMCQMYFEAGFNFLSFNNRGTAAYTEAIQGGAVTYIGTAVEKFEDCLLDLTAAVEFARTIGSRVVLQGHSFGCEKIMYFAQKADSNIELIILSPSDGYRLQELYISPETVEGQLDRLRSLYKLEGLEWLPAEEYGIRVDGVNYHVPIVAWSLVGLITGPPFELLRLSKPWKPDKLANRAFIYIGGSDPLQVDGAEAMADGMRCRFVAPTILMPREGRHDLRPRPEEVIGTISRWLQAATLEKNKSAE